MKQGSARPAPIVDTDVQSEGWQVRFSTLNQTPSFMVIYPHLYVLSYTIFSQPSKEPRPYGTLFFPLSLSEKQTPYASVHFSAGKKVRAGGKKEIKTVHEKNQMGELITA